jgi:hypothetical protein
LFLCWFLCSEWWDFCFVLWSWLLLQSASPPPKHIQHHELNWPSPNFKKVKGVHFGPTKGSYLKFLCLSQISRRYAWFKKFIYCNLSCFSIYIHP